MPRFDLSDVTKLRPGREDGLPRAALQGVSATIPSGSAFAVVGPSGAGKTTLLRLLNRLEDPTSGAITLDGAPLCETPALDLRRRVGMVFQVPVMFPGTVRDNLLLAWGLADGTRPAPEARAPGEEELSALVTDAGLDGSFLAREAQRLSLGEMQRVSLARALACRPSALLLDEPASALDAAAAARLHETLRALHAGRGLTIVLVSHAIDDARALATHAMRLEAGRVVASGPAREVL
jgi:putative ABC transport system ATP-binding protein